MKTMISIFLFLITCLGTCELFLVSSGALFNWLFKKKNKKKHIRSSPKLACIVPAHNEEKQILKTIKSLQACQPTVDIIVIVDNSTDSTQFLAQSASVRTIVRNDLNHIGKHYALKFAFEELLKEGYELFVIIDADTWVDSHLFAEVISHFNEGVEALQVDYKLILPQPSLFLRLIRLSYESVNHLRPLGRDWWGLSAGIYGNGFAITRKILEKVPFDCETGVEDLEYHLKLVSHGVPVRYTENAAVYTTPPEKKAGFVTQRSRWEGGRLRLLISFFPKLLKQLFQGNYLCFEPLLDLALLPLSFHILLIIPLLFFTGWAGWYGLFAFGTVGLYLITTLLISKATFQDLLALFAAPYYVFWKVSLLKSILHASSKKIGWHRTER